MKMRALTAGLQMVHQKFLGPEYNSKMIMKNLSDIVEVWFDSGCNP